MLLMRNVADKNQMQGHTALQSALKKKQNKESKQSKTADEQCCAVQGKKTQQYSISEFSVEWIVLVLDGPVE